MSLLQACGVRKIYGALTALNGVDLTVAEHEFHGLIGPNGSGKSTLLKCLAGAENVTGGIITFMGKDVTQKTPADRSREGMSLKFQITSIMPSLSVYDADNVKIASDAKGQFVAWQNKKPRIVRIVVANLGKDEAALTLRLHSQDVAASPLPASPSRWELPAIPLWVGATWRA